MTITVEGYLAGFRVLDLTDQRGLLAGHVLAQMGADVIQVEPPSGNAARHQPPLQGERSFFWEAYAAGKRSITCDIDSETGRALFLRLAATADVLIESSGVGVLACQRLGYDDLKAANPRLIYVAITPFGSYGPKARYADSDLVLWAAGGALLPCRDGPDAPLRMSVPQAYLHASADAAVAALIALSARRVTGRGQYVDVSVQQSVAQATLSSVLAAAVGHEGFDLAQTAAAQGTTKPGKKSLDLSGSGARTRRSKWQAADGLVEFHLGIGSAAGGSTNALFAWMCEAGECDERFKDWDWITLPARLESDEISDADLQAARAVIARFFATRRKDDIEREAGRRKIMLAAIMTTNDLLANEHFAARGYFDTLEGPQGAYRTPGRFAIASNDGLVRAKPAPALGQDNEHVWRNIVGLAADELARVQRERVI
ncbi:MAG: CoA transferase [Steroidobacteraceae bacterium]